MLVAIAGALLAGALTTLAPCALSLLPVIVGGSIQTTSSSTGVVRRDLRRAVLVAGSLGVSVAVFTLLLRASTALIAIPPTVWRGISGAILIALGIVALFPLIWDRFSVSSGLSHRSATGLAAASRRDGRLGAILTGAALGPVFTSCSPLYGYVIVTVLPAEPGRALVLLAAYVVGLVAVLLAVAVAGQRFIRRLRWAADPASVWRRALGALFIVIGLLIATGGMQGLETWLLEHSPIRPWEIGSDIGT